MNTDQLARATFVIDRQTAEQLSAIAKRFGVSRSSLVRDVLAEPVELMHRWASALPDSGKMTPAEVQDFMWQLEADIGEFVDSKAAQLDLLEGEPGGSA